MPRTWTRLLAAVAIAAVVWPGPLRANDVDGPDDCQRLPQDFGDAPEGIAAYPGVIGKFPTCMAAGPTGTREAACAPRGSTPGIAGFVRHVSPAGILPYWLGCTAAANQGVDSENDGKVNADGAAKSACSDLAIDCVEAAFGMSFGQDECYGGSDAGLVGPRVFAACSTAAVTFTAKNCATFQRQVYLNVLLDMNEDGDWNDNFTCATLCAHEWAVKNAALMLPFGCSTLTSPSFTVGPRAGGGRAWLRVTLSDAPVGNDFPWNGSVTEPNQRLSGGETEDYPVMIRDAVGEACSEGYLDFGDAPEGFPAYTDPSIAGSVLDATFPTCLTSTSVGTRISECGPPSGTIPGPTGYVLHATQPESPQKFWLGCGTAADRAQARDNDAFPKVDVTPPAGAVTACVPVTAPDCTESSWLEFGQDECYGSPDATLAVPMTFRACTDTVLALEAYNCSAVSADVRINVLVDWNGDGDWNDNVYCEATDRCLPEWAARNRPYALAPGCNPLQVPVAAGGRTGQAWMRVTLTAQDVPDDFPWNGSLGAPSGSFGGGETEDYPVLVTASLLDAGPATPAGPRFAPPAPNPSREGTTLRFVLPRELPVRLSAHDIAGRVVRVLAEGRMAAGEHRLAWDFRDDRGRVLPAGVYLLELRTGDSVVTRRVIMLR